MYKGCIIIRCRTYLVHHRCLDLEEPAHVEEVADVVNDLSTSEELHTAGVVEDQVDVPGGRWGCVKGVREGV